MNEMEKKKERLLSNIVEQANGGISNKNMFLA